MRSRLRGTVFGLVLCAVAIESCGRSGWYRCHYRAVARAIDNSERPCVANVFDRGSSDPSRPITSEPAKSRGPFHGWLRVVRPKDPVILKARLVLQCEGFAPVSRDFEWNLAPDTCKPGVELGELPLTPLADGTQ